MELCEGGELFDRILKKTETAEGHYSERDAAKIMKRILSGEECSWYLLSLICSSQDKEVPVVWFFFVYVI